jgi:hypothetical protein
MLCVILYCQVFLTVSTVRCYKEHSRVTAKIRTGRLPSISEVLPLKLAFLLPFLKLVCTAEHLS